MPSPLFASPEKGLEQLNATVRETDSCGAWMACGRGMGMAHGRRDPAGVCRAVHDEDICLIVLKQGRSA